MLESFLERMAGTEFVDGAADCALTVDDWVVTATGCPDPAAHLRGRYRTPLGRERLLRRLGGLEAVMADCAARAGLEETANPVRGDVGLIRLEGCHSPRGGSLLEPGSPVQFAAICLGERWAVKSSAGLTVGRADRVVRAWSVPHG